MYHEFQRNTCGREHVLKRFSLCSNMSIAWLCLCFYFGLSLSKYSSEGCFGGVTGGDGWRRGKARVVQGEAAGGAGCAAGRAGGRCPHAAGGLCCERGHSAFGAEPEPSGHGEFYFSPGNMGCITNHFPATVEMFLLWK